MKYVVLAILLCACSSHGQQSPPPKPDFGTIVFIGDSITQLWPLDDYMQHAVNSGSSGEETAQMLARFDTDVIDKNPKTLVILGGTNDIRHNDSADPQWIYAMVSKARAAGIRVIVGTLPLAEYRLGEYPDVEKQLLAVLSDKIKRNALEHGYEVADFRPAFQFADGSINTTLYQDAYLHPNKQGYDAMWKVLLPMLH